MGLLDILKRPPKPEEPLPDLRTSRAELAQALAAAEAAEASAAQTFVDVGDEASEEALAAAEKATTRIRAHLERVDELMRQRAERDEAERRASLEARKAELLATTLSSDALRSVARKYDEEMLQSLQPFLAAYEARGETVAQLMGVCSELAAIETELGETEAARAKTVNGVWIDETTGRAYTGSPLASAQVRSQIERVTNTYALADRVSQLAEAHMRELATSHRVPTKVGHLMRRLADALRSSG